MSLVGSAIKTEKCLDILSIAVTSRDVFIKLEESKIVNIYMDLLSMSKEPAFAVKSFICLTGILKTNEWLACIPSTNAFVEIQCSLSVDRQCGAEFLTFLTVWMKILKKSSSQNTLYLPDKRIIWNYINRIQFIPQKKVSHKYGMKHFHCSL